MPYMKCEHYNNGQNTPLPVHYIEIITVNNIDQDTCVPTH